MNYLRNIGFVDMVNGVRRDKVLRDRSQPLEMNDCTFHKLTKFPKFKFFQLLIRYQNSLERFESPLSAQLQLFITIRFYATRNDFRSLEQ